MAAGPLRRAHVAVIGAGPAGLAVARELLREGHTVVIFDAADGLGGAWRFDGTTDSDLLGLSAGASNSHRKVHSSMYPILRVNQPRQVMSLCDFPFSTEALGQRSHDARVYPLHSEVLAFCEALADAAGLRQHLVLHTRVLHVDPVVLTQQQQQQQQQHSQPDPPSPRSTANDASAAAAAAAELLWQQPGLQWRVTTETTVQHMPTADGQQQQQQREWIFDAVAACGGTFSEPRLPNVAGMAGWPGVQLHSHNFREPAAFKGQRVIVVGASFSGEEIARHIAREAREVLHCARTFTGPGSAREPAAAAAAAADTAHPQPTQQCQQCQDHTQQQQQQQQSQQHCEQQQQQQGAIPPAPEPRPNIRRLPMLQELLPDGSVVLVGGQVVTGVDAIVWCTGFNYSLPWMQHLGLVQTDNACVRPLFAHMFTRAGPSLALCGLPWRSLKFPQFQLQGQLLARLLSGRAVLPPLEVQEQDQRQLFAAMRAQGIPLRYTHCMAGFMPQHEWAYAEQLCQLCDGTWRGNSYQQQERSLPLPPPLHEPPLQEQPQQPLPQEQQQPPPQEQQQQLQQQQQQTLQPRADVLRLPGWMQALALATGPGILGAPDSFRDTWSEEVGQLMAAADAAMHELYVAGVAGSAAAAR